MVIVDIETTGLQCERNCILSIGAVDFSNPTNTFYGECRMDEGNDVSEEALAINGFTQDSIRDTSKQSVKELLTDFIHWIEQIEDQTFAGQNVSFDRDFIYSACKKHGLTYKIGKRLVDLHAICYTHMLTHGKPITLKDNASGLYTDIILAYVGLKERDGIHNGLEDAKLEAEAFSRLLYGKGMFAEYTEYTIPQFLIKE